MKQRHVTEVPRVRRLFPGAGGELLRRGTVEVERAVPSMDTKGDIPLALGSEAGETPCHWVENAQTVCINVDGLALACFSDRPIHHAYGDSSATGRWADRQDGKAFDLCDAFKDNRLALAAIHD